MIERIFQGGRLGLLGFGTMRLPLQADGTVDENQVRAMTAHAMANGVNYFDTAPVYLQGMSETATGIALSRHPRDSYFLATKLSNQRNYTRENSLAMYRQSLKSLQTDYLDYYLMHSIGGGSGIQLFEDRYINNGVLDFLLK